MDDTSFVNWMEQRPVRPLWRAFGWISSDDQLGPPRETSTPPLEGFHSPQRYRSRMWLLGVPFGASGTEWVSPDGRTLLQESGESAMLHSYLEDGTAVATWPDDPTGHRVSSEARPDNHAAVGTGRIHEDYANHITYVDSLTKTHGPAIRWSEPEARFQMGLLYNVHFMGRTTVLLGLGANAIGILCGLGMLAVWLSG